MSETLNTQVVNADPTEEEIRERRKRWDEATEKEREEIQRETIDVDPGLYSPEEIEENRKGWEQE